MKFFNKITTFEKNHPILALFPIVIPRIILENLLCTLGIEVGAILVSTGCLTYGFYKSFSAYLNDSPVNSFYSAIKFLVNIPLILIFPPLAAALILVAPAVLALLNAVTTILYLPIKQTIFNLSVGPIDAFSLHASDGVVAKALVEQTVKILDNAGIKAEFEKASALGVQ